MIKYLLITACLVMGFCMGICLAGPLEIEPGKVPSKKELVEKCKEGCLVIDGQDFQSFVARAEEFAQQAFMAGVLEGSKSCKKPSKDI